MAETRNLGGLADAIFAEIDRLQDPEPRGIVDLTCPYLSRKRECMVYEARPEICRGYSCSKHASGELLVDVQLLKSLSTAVYVDMRLLAEAI